MATFKREQERLWKTVDELKNEYKKYLLTLSKEELVEELLQHSIDRFYGAFTTDLVMNMFLEKGWLSEEEANKLPIDYFKKEIEFYKKERKG